MNTYDPIIRMNVEEHFPELLDHFGPFGWLWIKAQIWQESRFDPAAVSPVGAMGLMQIMPTTAADLGLSNPHSPVQSISGGVRYLAQQYRKFTEIPTYRERIRFALASYNGGRGYVNFALVLARDAEGLPGPFLSWKRAGRPAGQWQTWQFSAAYLADERINIGGRSPDHKQMWGYVAKIEDRFNHYFREATQRKC